MSWFVPPSTTKHQSSDRVGAFFMPWFGSLSSSLGSWSSSSRFVTVTSGRIGVHHRFGSDPCLSLVTVRIGVLHCTLDRFGSFSSWRSLLRYNDPVRFVVKGKWAVRVGRGDPIRFPALIPATFQQVFIRLSTAFSTILTIETNHKAYQRVIATHTSDLKHQNYHMKW